MISLIDSSLWIDFFRPRTSPRLKELIATYLLDSAAHLSEPVLFEVLRHALPNEVPRFNRQFATVPTLITPGDLWERATVIGQACRRKGHTAGALDLVIAAVAAAHDAVIVTFDADFVKVGEAAQIPVKLLNRS